MVGCNDFCHILKTRLPSGQRSKVRGLKVKGQGHARRKMTHEVRTEVGKQHRGKTETVIYTRSIESKKRGEGVGVKPANGRVWL